MIEKEYTLKINKPRIEPSECGKWYLNFFNRAIVNSKCPVKIDINNVGDTDFPGGFLEIKLNVHHRLMRSCEVNFDKYELPYIKRGNEFKIKSWISFIGSCDKNALLVIRINSKDSMPVKFVGKPDNLEDIDRAYIISIQTSTCDQLEQYFWNKIKGIIFIISFLFTWYSGLLQWILGIFLKILN